NRPAPTFVKALLHNAVFRGVPEVAPFNNKRNLAGDANGNKVAVDLRTGPPASTTPLLPPPEVLDNEQNVAGLIPTQAAQRTTGVTPHNRVEGDKTHPQPPPP